MRGGVNVRKEQVMRAVRFKTFGDPSVLKVAEIAAPAIDKTMALVRTMAASINPSDVKNVAGAMKQTTLPRTPGRDFAGVVEAGPAEWIGAPVWGHRRRYRLYSRRQPCGDDRRAGG
jgi:NADPH2:quinone reductase